MINNIDKNFHLHIHLFFEILYMLEHSEKCYNLKFFGRSLHLTIANQPFGNHKLLWDMMIYLRLMFTMFRTRPSSRHLQFLSRINFILNRWLFYSDIKAFAIILTNILRSNPLIAIRFTRDKINFIRYKFVNRLN